MYCPNCGAKVDANDAFCFECGFRLNSGARAPPAPGPEPAYSAPEPVRKDVSVALAVILSIIIPGIGHMYLGKIEKGLAILIASAVFLYLFALVSIIIWLYGIIDAYGIAKSMERSS